MKWINQDRYHEKYGPWIIATYFSRDKVRFGLSNGNKSYGFFESKDDAKIEANKLNKND